MEDKTTCAKCSYSGYACLDVVGGVRLCGVCKSKAAHPHWPRGRYNCQRIMGASVKFAVDLTYCRWKPRWDRFSHCFSWLWFRLWIQAVYE